MPGKTAMKILSIEEEYNNDFRSVVRTFADAGHSISDTAELLDIGRHAFRDLVDHMNIRDWFIRGRDSIANQMAYRGLTPGREKALEKARKIRFDQHAWEYRGILDTTAGHARRYGITIRAVNYRRSKNIPLERN